MVLFLWSDTGPSLTPIEAADKKKNNQDGEVQIHIQIDQYIFTDAYQWTKELHILQANQ